MGSSNPVKKVKNAVGDAYSSVTSDPVGALIKTSTITSQGLNTGGLGEMYGLGIRTRNDQRDQAAGMAQSEQNRAAAAEARAVDASVKELDPIALERRRRAALTSNNGRSGTILTAGTSLGSANVSRKWLLGQ